MTTRTTQTGEGSRGPEGRKAALEMALQKRPPELKIEERLDLLGLPDTPAMRKQLDAHKRIGRPPNSRNKRTTEWADYILSQYSSPLIGLAQIASTPVEVLAKRLGCTKLEAQQEIRLCLIALKDHLHSKMPVAVDVTNHKKVHLVFVDPDDELASARIDEGVIDLAAMEVVDDGK